MTRRAITRIPSLKPEGVHGFARLLERFSRGSTTQSVREAMGRPDAAEVAEELADLRRYGQSRAKATGAANVDVPEAVRKTLHR